MKKLLFILITLLILLIIIVVIKTFTYPFKKANTKTAEGWKMVKDDSAIQRLSGGLKIPSVSSGELGKFNYSPFDTIKEYIKNSYPLVYQNTEFVEINTYGLVFRLKGNNSSLDPILFLSHTDVVPPGDAEVKDKSACRIRSFARMGFRTVFRGCSEWKNLRKRLYRYERNAVFPAGIHE